VSAGEYPFNFDKKLVIENAYLVIRKIIPESHPEFLPKSSKDIEILRSEKTGVIDFLYTSADGKHRGSVYCQLPQLLKFDSKNSNLADTCFRTNIHQFESMAINGVGKQVGIY
jgi:hypothetical protein